MMIELKFPSSPQSKSLIPIHITCFYVESCFDTFHIQKASWLNTIGRYRHHSDNPPQDRYPTQIQVRSSF
ncbi:hypothetical protein M8C21_032772 [Ambrosia artemisiifolia]|uniref:Uncharacterized protein n=1 Tax=Ambrosia artemisiifolia TaxID=4212 RepID=A0AAD5GNK1_AMBAR|nr:hypothetical protein M8C21_032772 [Ambrosia artemisiifolia]